LLELDTAVFSVKDSFGLDRFKNGVVVEYHPEFYSSAQVLSIMGEQNKAIDASAAAIILQNYLDLQKHI
jgi:RNase H-fold protein (predicted Holliday junction resolvase)